MIGGLLKTCTGVLKPLGETLLLAGLFYAYAGDNFAMHRPDVFDGPLVRYRAAVNAALLGRIDVGRVDDAVIRVAATLNPIKQIDAVRDEIAYETHMTFNEALSVD